MPIDLSKSLDDLLRELEWDSAKAQEIRFGDVASLRGAECGHFKHEILYQPVIPKSERFAQFIGTKYDVALFLESTLFLTKNPLGYIVENAFEWGHGRDEFKIIELECYFAPKGFLIVVRDQGKGFDPRETLQRQENGLNPTSRPDGIGGGAFTTMKQENTCTYSYNQKGNEAYILCLTANAQRADGSKIYPNYFPKFLGVKRVSEAKS